MAGNVMASIGEILWDNLPEGKTLGGAPTNVAWHAGQLGADIRLISAVGADDAGRDLLRRLDALSLPTADVTVVPGRPTSTVDATLDAAGNAAYVIHENVAWDFIADEGSLASRAKDVDAVNFGTLAQRSPISRKGIRAFVLATPPHAVRMFDLNLRPPHYDREVLEWGLGNATAVKMNDSELEEIASLFSLPSSCEGALETLLSRYGNLRHAIVTRGGEGVLWASGGGVFEKKPPPGLRIVDTVGAGDSVTAVAITGLMRGEPIAGIVETAVALASHVCSRRGGTPALPAELVAGAWARP